MVQSRAQTVDDFLLEVSDDRRPALARLRGLCLEAFGAEHERMAFGMPAYGDPKNPWIAFNSQKQHIALYAGQDAIARFGGSLGKASFGKGCIRWSKPDAMKFEVIADIVADVAARKASACG
ncbi:MULTISPECIES: iron chaperone [unclassified Caulobacter]|uniref:iron chaperone n=1 Tax=unclassified Caulobacter TaxID=2648921 RepID=UPI000D3B2D76|nr:MULTISPECIES: DUF1801 domain-containing protein [unclassified Caulobacter]PTS81846.1 DUF1801 domain-containing protein [Caulobacter sp. HMWF009]PTT08920.1 DUF1801 domain-containing protein [Caulobacter sp. HMWF025]